MLGLSASSLSAALHSSLRLPRACARAVTDSTCCKAPTARFCALLLGGGSATPKRAANLPTSFSSFSHPLCHPLASRATMARPQAPLLLTSECTRAGSASCHMKLWQSIRDPSETSNKIKLSSQKAWEPRALSCKLQPNGKNAPASPYCAVDGCRVTTLVAARLHGGSQEAEKAFADAHRVTFPAPCARLPACGFFEAFLRVKRNSKKRNCSPVAGTAHT